MDNVFSDEELKERILKLKKERNAIILAHNYQRDEVQEIADICGDSLGLSIEASKSDADVIIFCGVHFMAESASILSPQKTVILPRYEAGCPMADMVTAEELQKMQSKYPEAVTVCYVNSSADVKAVSDICCTSANAVNVVNSVKEDVVLMVPDKNLAMNTAKHTSKKIIPWEGFCPTHHLLKEEDVIKAKKEHPNALLVVHPECPPEVVRHADHICSTSGMYKFVKENPSKEFIIGTEQGILFRMKKENPDKRFYLPADNLMICPNMKLTRLLDILNSLETLTPVVKVEEEIRKKAFIALKRMIDIPRD
ncbi:MAG: quinolinate synthase NadA [Candidatus Schekmanbacteria bacterium]|nr:MAG: quinolinate synthase NadA [Candidatus Schekmanbacteria bacterium]